VVGLIVYLIFIGAAIKSATDQPHSTKICALGLVATLIADSITHAPLFLVTEAQFFILLFAALLIKNRKNTIDTK
jgi:hypothetical protein